jgi:micrococcal nuclease
VYWYCWSVGTAAVRTRQIAASALALFLVSCGGSSASDTLASPATTSTSLAAEVSDETTIPTDVRTVARVIDGDTIIVDGDERVRLIGVDTPETKDPRKPVQCFGEAASAYTASLIPPGTAVRLVYDVERTDRYDRTLAYVYRVEDDGFLNAALVRDGYAVTATYPPNGAHADEFAALASEARSASRGLWGQCGEGETATTVAGGSAGDCDAAYPSACIPGAPPDLDCGDIAQRRFEVRPPDPHGFDRDGDGIGCES